MRMKMKEGEGSFPYPLPPIIYHPYVRKSWMELEARRPAPMARITVAEPVTMSPPAQTRGFMVLPVLGSATM